MFAPSPQLPACALASNPTIESRSPSIHAPSPRLPPMTLKPALHDDILDAPSPQLPSWWNACSSTTGVEPPSDRRKLLPEEWSLIAPSPLLLMANLDMSIHNIPLPFHQYHYPGSLEMLVFPNPHKSILHLSEDMTLATRTCALVCCKPVITAEAPNIKPKKSFRAGSVWVSIV